MNKLVLLSDYGLDDAVALLYILDTNGDKYSAIDILAVGGNTSAKNSMLNLKKILSNYTNKTPQLCLVDTSKIKQNYATLPDVHGTDGLGDVLNLKPVSIPVLPFKTWLKTFKKQQFTSIDIASLGPATVTKKLIQKTKKINYNNILLMGHLLNEKPNYNGEEFNYILDKKAFDWCIKKTKCVVASLDTCRQPEFNLAQHSSDSDTPFDLLLGTAVNLAVKRHADNAYIYDYIAVRFLFENNLFNVVKRTDKNGLELNHLEINR